MLNNNMANMSLREEIAQAGDSSEDELAYSMMLRKRERTVLHYIKLCLLFLSVLFTVAFVGAYLWHLIAPERWRWLSSTDLESLRGMAITIITGLILSQMTAYFYRKH